MLVPRTRSNAAAGRDDAAASSVEPGEPRRATKPSRGAGPPVEAGPPSRRKGRSLIGRGSAPLHWGELVQGPYRTQGGHVTTGAITLPLPTCRVHATFQPDRTNLIRSEPAHCTKARGAVEETLTRCGFKLGGLLKIESDTPGAVGAGRSTADLIAAVRATLDAVHCSLSDGDMMDIVFRHDRASDPLLMIERGKVVLYGTRIGKPLHVFAHRLPPLSCLGFITHPGREVRTEDLLGKEAYTDKDVEAFESVLSTAAVALKRQDSSLLGNAATRSAELNQKRLRTRRFFELVRVAERVGAVGLSISHSGTAASLLFDRYIEALSERYHEGQYLLRDVGCSRVFPFCPDPGGCDDPR